MATLKRSTVIDAPTDKVFAYVNEPSTMADWLPSMVEVRNVRGEGEGQQYDWTYKMAGMLLRGQSVVVEHVPYSHAVHQSIGMINSTWTFELEPGEEGTKLRLDIDFVVPVPVLGKLAENVVMKRAGRNIECALDNAKDVLEH
jgi:carbon monoxide dehydrogenase subunit G